jgi:hypothetical protein
MAWADLARFYTIPEVFGERDVPSVTEVLKCLNKPGLVHWYANQERRHLEHAVLEVAADAEARRVNLTPSQLLNVVLAAVQGVKAADRAKQEAGDIGTAAHALVEWHTRVQLGEDAGLEPQVPDAALLAVEAWKDWCKDVQFEPIWVERVVYHRVFGYAGTADWLARVKGVVTLGDIKTGKAIYPEAWLQNRAYRSAWEQMVYDETTPSPHPLPRQGLILRLPKTLEDPTFEAQFVPEWVRLEDFLAAKKLWEWQRKAEGKPIDRKAAL